MTEPFHGKVGIFTPQYLKNEWGYLPKTHRFWTWGAAPSSNPMSFSKVPPLVLEIIALLCSNPPEKVVQSLAARPGRVQASSPTALAPRLAGSLRISDEKSQIALIIPLLLRQSVRGVPQLHGSMTLVERHRTIYFRAENSNVAEQERDSKVHFCRPRCDAAANHDH